MVDTYSGSAENMGDGANRLHTAVLSVSHYACPPELCFHDFAAAVADAGYDAVALTRRSFDELGPQEINRVLAARGLTVSSVNSAGYFLHSDPERASRQAAENRRLLRLTAETPAHGLNVIVGGALDHPQALEQARERAQEALVSLAEEARGFGVRLLVEPVHPAGISAKGCFNTIAQTRKAIAGIPNALLTIDLFHSWWDPDLRPTLNDPRSPVGLLQICDAAADDAGFDILRRVPGGGVVDIRACVAASRLHHPRVPVELEIFAEHFADFDLIGSLREVRDLLGRRRVGRTSARDRDAADDEGSGR